MRLGSVELNYRENGAPEATAIRMYTVIDSKLLKKLFLVTF